MLKNGCINPEIMSQLARCGHGDKILIADGNYPLASMTAGAYKVYLGVAAGIPGVPDVLKAIAAEVEFEKAEVMVPDDGQNPLIFNEFRERLDLDLVKLGRYEFYDACKENAVRLAISTGETRKFANILLTIGCPNG